MSGHWEVVGKSKKDKQSGKSKKLSKIELQKFSDNAPKVEDLLPLDQVQSLYAALDVNKSVPKLTEKTTKTKENEAKKNQKKTTEKKEPSTKEKPTIKPVPKTIEAALALITAAQLQNVLDVSKQRFPDGPLVWLKELATWLNAKLPVDHADNNFTAKSWDYPLCLLGSNMKSVLKNAIKDAQHSTVQMFYDFCLTSMVSEMTKGSPVTGYKLLLQLVASQQPSVATSDLDKVSGVRHSYQNRPAIGCAVMWALGQAGFKDLPTGLRVWLSVMFPVLELRHYSQFVCDYLKHLLARHSTSKAVSAQLYLEIFDAVRSSANNQLNAHILKLQGIVYNALPSDRVHTVFKPLLTRLNSNLPPPLKNQLVQFLMRCLTEDSQSFAEWRQLYTKHLPHSVILLTQLKTGSYNLGKNTRHLNDTLKTFKVTNEETIKNKQKVDGLSECSRLCNEMISKIGEGKSFPWKTLSFMIFIILAGTLAFDIKSHGSFKGSRTGVFLKDTGALKHVEQAGSRVQQVWVHIYSWGKQNVPVFLAAVQPYLISARDWVSVYSARVNSTVTQFWLDNRPIIEQWVSPSLLETLSHTVGEAWRIIVRLGSIMVQYFILAIHWSQQNIFVGDLQRVTMEALNTTQTAAVRAFNWLTGISVLS